MFENRRSENVGVNWRGPLLAVGIFGVIFAILLLMAHQNESKTSDMGSSLREDPYGTSLLFDSYARAGYEVKRSQDQDSLSDQNALKTTAFFIGGYPAEDWRMEKGKIQMGEKLRGRIENFLAGGGRVVLISPAWRFKSESQGWDVKNKWDQKANQSGPSWLAPDAGSMPAGSEKIYLGADSPWLETDQAWTLLYAKPAGEKGNADGVHAYVAMRKVGNGELIAASQESFLLNEAIKKRPNPVLLDFVAGGRPVLWVDETLHGLHQEQGVLWLVQRYRLQTALLFCWASLLALLWSMRGDLVRRPAFDQSPQIVRQGEGRGVAARRLLQRSIAREQVATECWEQFRRRSPQDADAISGDLRWGPRLRRALVQPPLAGYSELSQLIAERRASAKRFAGSNRESTDGSTVLSNRSSGEERTT
jgi:hypothetical protein